MHSEVRVEVFSCEYHNTPYNEDEYCSLCHPSDLDITGQGKTCDACDAPAILHRADFFMAVWVKQASHNIYPHYDVHHNTANFCEAHRDNEP
jgi:hypothetical protein